MRLYPHTDEEIAEYSWEDFLRHCVYVTNIQGSALYDATLGDADMIDAMYEQQKAKQSSKIKEEKRAEEEWRPSRRGYSREVEALYDLTSNVVALRGEMGHWSRTTSMSQMPKRPWFPSEVVEERLRSRSMARRDDAIAASQQRHRERKAAASG